MTQEHRGQCAYCGEPNPYTSLTCNHCYTRLPWADALTQSSMQNSTTALASPPTAQWAAPPVSQGTPDAQAPLTRQARFCSSCGSQHAHGAAFCASCGTPVQGSQLQGVPTHVVSPTQGVVPHVQPMTAHVTKKRGLAWLLGGSDPAHLPQNAAAQMAGARMMAPQAMPPQGMPWYGAPQQNVSVNVVTAQKGGGHGWWARLWLFIFKVSLVLAFLGGVLAAIASR